MFKYIPVEKQKVYIGPVPEECDLCKCQLIDEWIDGQLYGHSSWANMCRGCAEQYASGIGQVYEKGEDGNWRKVRSSL